MLQMKLTSLPCTAASWAVFFINFLFKNSLTVSRRATKTLVTLRGSSNIIFCLYGILVFAERKRITYMCVCSRIAYKYTFFCGDYKERKEIYALQLLFCVIHTAYIIKNFLIFIMKVRCITYFPLFFFTSSLLLPPYLPQQVWKADK